MNQPNEKRTDQTAGKLIAYLRDKLCNATIAYDLPLTQLQGGFETTTYQFRLKGVQEPLDRRLILRVYPEDRDPNDAVWESSVQNALADAGYPVARAHLVCTDTSILGGAFFLMDFLLGKPLWTAPWETVPKLLANTHAALHRIVIADQPTPPIPPGR